MLQGDSSREDRHGEPDHQEPAGTSEGPTVSRIDIRLEVRSEQDVVRTQQKTRKELAWSDLYLDYSSRRLREIPERKPKQTKQSHLSLVRLRTTSADDAAPCRTSTVAQQTGEYSKRVDTKHVTWEIDQSGVTIYITGRTFPHVL